MQTTVQAVQRIYVKNLTSDSIDNLYYYYNLYMKPIPFKNLHASTKDYVNIDLTKFKKDENLVFYLPGGKTKHFSFIKELRQDQSKPSSYFKILEIDGNVVIKREED